jgi:hypothetical protein
MRTLIVPLAAASLATLALSARPADAAPSFTGKIEMQMSHGASPAGTAVTFLGDEGMVGEIQMASLPTKIKTLVRFDKPDTVYLIDDAQKTYTERNMPAVVPNDETWTVKKLGSEKILGYATTHVQATSSKGMSMELWTTKELINSDVIARAMSRSSQLPGNLFSALEKESAAGFMLRMVNKGKDGNTMRMEVVKIDKQALPKSMFSLPAGYAKAAAPSIPGMQGLQGMPPETQKKLEEAMKNMTPEQRAAMQKAMGGQK